MDSGLLIHRTLRSWEGEEVGTGKLTGWTAFRLAPDTRGLPTCRATRRRLYCLRVNVIRQGLALTPAPFVLAVVPGALVRRGSRASRGGQPTYIVVGRVACPHLRLPGQGAGQCALPGRSN